MKISIRQLPREVLILSVVGFFVAVGFGMIIPAIPLFAKTFGVSTTAVGFIISMFAISRFGSGLISGKFVDRIGERLTLGIGLFLVAISSLLCGLATSYTQLLLFRMAGGLGSSMFSVSAGALLMRSVTTDQRARAQSTYNGGFLLGGITGPAFGGLLMAISLRVPFFIYTATLLCASFIAFFYLHEKRLTGSTTAMTDPAERILLRHALKDSVYRIVLLLNFLNSWVLFGLRGTLLPLFVTEVLHAPTKEVGYGFTVAAVAQTALLIYAGHLADKYGRRAGVMIGASLLMATLGFLIFGHSMPLFYIAMIIYGIGGAFMGTAPASIVGDLFGGKGGQVIALFQMAGDAGMIVSPLILGYLKDAYSYTTAFSVTAVVYLLTLICGARIPETRSAKHEIK
jgi:MFS family permease